MAINIKNATIKAINGLSAYIIIFIYEIGYS